MHIKASHESGSAGVSEGARCRECDRGFSSARDKAYHASKVHGAPKPEGVFEDCSLCDKWFKTKGELSQHMARIHQVANTFPRIKAEKRYRFHFQEKGPTWQGGQSVVEESLKSEGT